MEKKTDDLWAEIDQTVRGLYVIRIWNGEEYLRGEYEIYLWWAKIRARWMLYKERNTKKFEKIVIR